MIKVRRIVNEIDVLSFSIRFPFDWKTPLTYAVAWSLQFAGGCGVFTIEMPFFGFYFGSCWLFVFIAGDITQDLVAFNKGELVNRNRVEKMTRFCDIIRIYSDAKQ